ncbi:MAG: class Ib ribonucleoside-diphosphate reductase assembly flavoprotein NrdI [Leucobacter sp.]
MTQLIYFSSVSGNTHRFVEKLGREAKRIPLYTNDDTILADEPFVLVVPTYGGGHPKTAVPKQVIKFLNVLENRQLIRGVIAVGNTNFGSAFGLAGNVIARKCEVPVLYKFEVFGTPDDVQTVNEGLDQFWQQQPTPLAV